MSRRFTSHHAVATGSFFALQDEPFLAQTEPVALFSPGPVSPAGKSTGPANKETVTDVDHAGKGDKSLFRTKRKYVCSVKKEIDQ
jgi:hypothetical protein